MNINALPTSPTPVRTLATPKSRRPIEAMPVHDWSPSEDAIDPAHAAEPVAVKRGSAAPKTAVTRSIIEQTVPAAVATAQVPIKRGPGRSRKNPLPPAPPPSPVPTPPPSSAVPRADLLEVEDIQVHDGPLPPTLKPVASSRLTKLQELVASIAVGQWFIVPGSARLETSQRRTFTNSLRKLCERRGTAISIRTTTDRSLLVIREESRRA